MKLFKYIFIIFILTTFNLFSLDCEIDEDCEEQSFNYNYCDGNRRISKCSHNPYNTYDDQNNLLQPMKQTGCFEYDALSYKFEKYNGAGSIINNLITEDDGDIIFALNLMQKEINDAKQRWKDNCKDCNLNNDFINTCCIKIKWTKNELEFPNSTFDEPVTGISRKKITNTAYCEIDCSDLTIYLNQTDNFTGYLKGDLRYKQFFFTRNKAYTEETFGNVWWNLYATLLHEMGHMFGFDHSVSSKKLIVAPPCLNSSSIMSNFGFEKGDRDLTEEDICMYKKMYCWTPTTGIDDYNTNNDLVYTFPNPSSERFL